eukprot:6294560-Pyramimonas_sp.AAC.1
MAAVLAHPHTALSGECIIESRESSSFLGTVLLGPQGVLFAGPPQGRRASPGPRGRGAFWPQSSVMVVDPSLRM